jgi:hypothetical protein
VRIYAREHAEADLNELLRPSMQDVRPLADDQLPWRLRAQLWIGFFGGALAVTAVAWENARRLGAPSATRSWILAVGGAGVIAATAVGCVLSSRPSSMGTLLAYRIIGIAVAVILERLQRSPDRVHQYRRAGWSDEDLYDGAFAVGIGACLAGVVVQSVIVALIGGIV